MNPAARFDSALHRLDGVRLSARLRLTLEEAAVLLHADFESKMTRGEAAELLGVEPDADASMVKKAHAKKILSVHPDQGGSTEDAAKLNVARDILLGKRPAASESGQSRRGGAPAWAETAHGTPPSDEVTAYHQAIEYLDSALTKTKKGHGWWKPPHNFLVNTALMEINFWRFTLLPMRGFYGPERAYRPAKQGKPEGIALSPSWTSIQNRGIPYEALDALKRVVETAIPKTPTLEDSIVEELSAIEQAAGITIPAAVEAYLQDEVPKLAARRWGTKLAHNTGSSKIFIPFDGSKPFKVGSWG